MADERLNKQQFFDKLAELDEGSLKQALWTLCWRGSAPMRARVGAAIDPTVPDVRRPAAKARPAPGVVSEFAALARRGCYLAGDRRMSPKD